MYEDSYIRDLSVHSFMLNTLMLYGVPKAKQYGNVIRTNVAHAIWCSCLVWGLHVRPVLPVRDTVRVGGGAHTVPLSVSPGMWRPCGASTYSKHCQNRQLHTDQCTWRSTVSGR